MVRLFLKPSLRKPAPELANTNSQRVVTIGTILWALALIACLVFYDALSNAGLGWWLHTAIFGVMLGIFGLGYLRVNRL